MIMNRNEVLEEALEAISVLPRLAPTALAEVERASKRGGDIAAAQRLWSLTLAAADGRAYSELIDDHAAAEETLRNIAKRLRRYIVEKATPVARIHQQLPLRRFLLCLDFLPPTNRYGSHLHQVCSYAAALASLPGAESVLIMVSGESMPERNVLSQCYAGFEGDYADAWEAALRKVASPESTSKVTFYDSLTDEDASPITEVIEAAVRFEPDAIVYIQGLLRSSLMPEILKDVAPQVAVQFNVLNPEPEFCDLILSLRRGVNFQDKPTPVLWTSNILPMVPLASDDEGEPLPAMPNAAVRIVTALGLGRIEKSLLADPNLASQMAKFLRETSEAAWIFIGIATPDVLLDRYPDWRQLVDGGRILLMGHTFRLREAFAACTLYVHPPGFGGGAMGVGMAIAEGLPVLVEAGTDPANFVGDEAVFGTSEEAFALLGELMNNPSARRSLAIRQAEALEASHSIDAVARCLHGILPLAAKHFASRRKAH
jgi:hypothetical protein